MSFIKVRHVLIIVHKNAISKIIQNDEGSNLFFHNILKELKQANFTLKSEK